MLSDLIRLAVIAKLNELEEIPVGAASGRRLSVEDLRKHGIELSADQLRLALANNYRDIAERLGIQFMNSPATKPLKRL